MRLLMHDTLVTGMFLAPLVRDWVEPAADVTVETRADLRAADVQAGDAALIPASEVTLLQQSHQVVPAIAVVAEGIGPISLRTPVRPDEVERTPVRSLGASGVAELLARATLQPYFGIQATAWARDVNEPAAEAIILEGAAAMRPIEGGFAEDLCRAWFILTGLPVVTHLLIVPLTVAPIDLQSVVDTLRVAGAAGHERRREWRTERIERDGLDRERVNALFAGLRYKLTPADRRALVSLVQRGGRGSAYPPLTTLQFVEPPATDVDPSDL
ncbi:MAG: hypothetical protein M3464_04315 [Chloroflexota bacterium]|nr:hypothetical protein [Chloroflexota bacterium]